MSRPLLKLVPLTQTAFLPLLLLKILLSAKAQLQCPHLIRKLALTHPPPAKRCERPLSAAHSLGSWGFLSPDSASPAPPPLATQLDAPGPLRQPTLHTLSWSATERVLWSGSTTQRWVWLA